MKKILTLSIISLLLVSTFAITAPQVKAEMTDPSSTGLYAGSTNPGAVWEYKGGSTWDPISPLIGFDMIEPLGWSVTSITLYEGKLFAVAITHPDIYSSSGRVWRYEGDQRWTPVGILEEQVTFLIVYKGDLYAGTATPARLYKYNPITTSWTKALEYAPWFGFRSAYVWGDWLYLGEWYYDRLARWNGVNFEEFQPYYWGSCIYSFDEYCGNLYAGAYIGRIYRVTYHRSIATSIWGPEPHYRYAWSVKTFKDCLYIGFDANGTRTALLYKYDGTNSPAPIWSYSTTTTNPYEGIISMATDEAYLYIGVGGQAVGYPSYMSGAGAGKIYKSSDGINFEPASGIMGAGIQTLYIEKPLPAKAAEFAKLVIGRDYRTKLYDSVTKGYKGGRFVSPEEIEYLDCSGLVFWSYNKAYGSTKYSYSFMYDGADAQYRNNFGKKISEAELRPGDVLFFDWESDGKKIDHVAMYVGKCKLSSPVLIEWLKYYKKQGVLRTDCADPLIEQLTERVAYALYDEGFEFDVVQASGDAGHSYGIIPDTVKELKAKRGFWGFYRWTGPKVALQVEKTNGTDLIVTDPDGFTITKEVYEISGVLYYIECDVDGDGDLDDIVTVPERKIGDYLITVMPEPTDYPTDTYTLTLFANGITILLAENVLIRDIPVQPYIVRLTETEVIPIIPATVDFDPDVLNLKSIGQWVTVYIELPVGHGYNVNMIDLATIRLDDQVRVETKPIAIGDHDNNGIPDLMVKFGRKAVEKIFWVGDEVEITISGKLTDGRLFEGKDTIRVILPP
jgi:hypothetical protein